MSKNILILSGSPRKGGNSDILCDRFMEGARESGHRAEKVFLRDKNIGYCIGCIETAYVVGRIWQVDLRQHGSGNLGTTNALRVLGKKAGALVFIGDIMKSVIAFVICRAIFGSNLAGVYGSVGAVLGHNYPF